MSILEDVFNLAINGLRGSIGSFGELSFEVYRGDINGFSVPGIGGLIHDEQASKVATRLLGGTKVMTFNDYKRRSRARYARHELINRATVLEKVGDDVEEVTLTIKLVRDLVDVEEQTRLIREYVRAGREEYLVIGNEVIGEFVITELEEIKEFVDGFGRTQVSLLNVTLEGTGNDSDRLDGFGVEDVIIN